jgi:hypothetical protein
MAIFTYGTDLLGMTLDRLLAQWVQQVQQVALALLVLQEQTLLFRALQGQLVILARQVLPVQLAISDLLDLRGFKVLKVFRAKLVPQAQQVHKVKLDQPVQLV